MAFPSKTLTIDALNDYLVGSFFKDWCDDRKLVGLELEVIPFKRSPEGAAFLVPLFQSGRAYSLWEEKDPADPWPGLVEFLKSNCGLYDGMKYAPLDEKTPRFLFNSGAQLTFEPGGQLEYSSAACPSIEEVTRSLFLTLESIEKLLLTQDIHLFHGALNPWFRTEEVGLQIAKQRYLVMDRYFSRLSPYGQKMMRLTASFQVNLDVGNQEVAQRRWLAANLLSPYFLAMFGNSPFHEGKRTQAKSYRAVIWENLDPTRTGFQDDFLNEEYCPCPARQYLNFALQAFCMLPVELGSQNPPVRFEEWMENGFNGLYPDMDDWITHLTTLFPEVRPRGFFEMRYMDTLPKAFYSVPGTLLRRFLYDDDLLTFVIEQLDPHRTQLRKLLHSAACEGLENPILREKATILFKKVLDQAPDKDQNLLGIAEVFFKNYTGLGLSPADELLKLQNGDCPTFDQFQDLAQKRLDLVEEPLSRLLNADLHSANQ